MEGIGTQETLLVMVAGMFILFMCVIIAMTLSRMKKRRKDINERIRQLELEMGGQYK